MTCNGCGQERDEGYWLCPECAESRNRTLASLNASVRVMQRDLLDPPADVQECVIRKLNLVSGDALDVAKARVVKLESLARELVKSLEYVRRWWDETGRDEGWHQSIGQYVESGLAKAREALK